MIFPRTSPKLASLAIASIVGFSAVTLSAQRPESAIAQEAAPTVTTKSSISDIKLARHLSEIGAKLYTAYWCPHCHYQKQRFGKYATQLLNVVECDRQGINPQTRLCRDKGIKGYPTWEIKGQLYPGNRSLEELADLSGWRR
jgi:hypothetical protein